LPQSVADPSPPGRWRGPLRAAVAAAVVLLASSVPGVPASSVAGIAASSVPGKAASSFPTVPAPSVSVVPSHAPGSYVLLQMNLCNSGMAVNSCYSFGKAVDEAVEKIGRYSPDLVMLQEVCRDDLYAGDGWGKLAQAMANLYGNQHVSVSFVPAQNRYTGSPYRCVNGEQYGVALIDRDGGPTRHYGWYRSQDPSDEIRAWTCATVIEGRLTGCTTHLSTDPGVAMRQCQELMSTLASPWVMPQVVVAGDFNLKYLPGKPHNVRDCAPPKYLNKNDDSLQQVFFSRGIRWLQGGYEAMRWTDHPLLYETFRL
jgi:endonuclease/exonuclease/phosphatase family metal-dependent hydrolase